MQGPRGENSEMCQSDTAGTGWEKQPHREVLGPELRNTQQEAEAQEESPRSVRGWVVEFHSNPMGFHGGRASVLSTESWKPAPSWASF